MAKEEFIYRSFSRNILHFVEILRIDFKCIVLLISVYYIQPNIYNMHIDRQILIDRQRENISLPLFHPACLPAYLLMITQNLICVTVLSAVFCNISFLPVLYLTLDLKIGLKSTEVLMQYYVHLNQAICQDDWNLNNKP